MIRLGPAAQSAIEVDAIEGADPTIDPPSFAVLREHYEAGKLRPASSREAVMDLHDALTELANAHDDRAEGNAPADADERRFARRAREQLTSAASRVLREWATS